MLSRWFRPLIQRTRRPAPASRRPRRSFQIEELEPRAVPSTMAFQLFDTGVDSSGALLAAGSTDPHYTLKTTPDSSGPSAFVVLSGSGSPVGNSWLANDPSSQWLAPQADQSSGNGAGEFVYHTTFNLTGFDPSTASLSGQWATDNAGLDVLINGASTGNQSTSASSFTSFTINSGFVAGVNTLDFVVRNDGATPNPTGFRAELSATANPLMADLSVTKTGSPNPVLAGQNLTYIITVSNAGPDAAEGSRLTDNLPDGMTFVSASSSTGMVTTAPSTGTTTSAGNDQVVVDLGTVAASGSATVTIVVRPTGAQAGTVLSNSATASTASSDTNSDNDTDTASTTVSPAADLSVTKTGAPNPVLAGDNLTYTISITNNGPNDAQNVTLSDDLPANTTFVSFDAPGGWSSSTPNPGETGSISSTIPTLAAGGSATFTVVVAVTAGTPHGTALSNTATASTDTADPVADNDFATAVNLVSPEADLGVVKTGSPDPVGAGQPLTYTVTVTNSGPDPAVASVLTDTLPDGVVFVSASTDTGTVSTTPPSNSITAPGSDQVVVALGTLSNGAAATITIVVQPSGSQAGTVLSNTATASTTSSDSNSSNDTATATTTVSVLADLAIAKTGQPNPVQRGTDLTYTISITNNGPNDAQNVALSDTLPAHTTFGSFAAPDGWSSTTPNMGETGSISSHISTLAAGASATFTVVVHVDSGADGGTLVLNTATVATTTTDPDPSNDSVTATTTIALQADLGVAKSGTPNPVVAGQPLTYTVTVTNSGPDDATAAMLTDTLPQGVVFVSAASDTGTVASAPAAGSTTTAGNDTVQVSLGTLAHGATATITIIVRPSGSQAGTALSNSATASTTTLDPNSSNDTATATTTVSASADLVVTKGAAPDPVAAGNQLAYTITVTNQGLNDAQNVTLSDVLPANTTFVSFLPPAGWSSNTPAVGGTGSISSTISSLVAGASATFTLVVHVNAATTDTTVLSNTAAASTTTTDVNLGNNSATATTTVSTQADLVMTKTASGTVAANSNLTYTITLTNSGPSDAQSVSFSDTVPANTTFIAFTAPSGWNSTLPSVGGTGSISSTLTTLPAGTNAVFTLIVHVNTGTPNGSLLSNTASAVTTTADPNTGNNQATANTTVSNQANLAVTQTPSSNSVAAGNNLTYTITVINNGTSAAQSVALTDTVPANTTFGSFTAPSGWTSTTPSVGGTGGITSTFASLAPGASATFTLVVHVNAGTTRGTAIANTAAASTTTSDSNTANNSATSSALVTTQTDLAVTGITSTDTPVAGTNLTFTLTIINNGPSNATGLTVTDTLPQRVRLLSAHSTQGTATMAGNVFVAFLGGLASGASATVTVVLSPSQAGTLTQTATITGLDTDPVSTNNTFTQNTTVAAFPSVVAVGAGPGLSPEVKVFDAVSQAVKFDFMAFDSSITGGVRVAMGDVNGDGIPDIAVVTGPGSLSRIRLFDGQSGVQLRDYFVNFNSSPQFTGGLFVAIGDIGNDGFGDIIVGADAGGAPTVKVFSGLDHQLSDNNALLEFLAYDSSFTGGVRVGAGDVNGDDFTDIITGSGANAEVKVFNGQGGGQLRDFFPYDSSFQGGVTVAGVKHTSTGKADILTGPDTGSNVKLFSGSDGSVLQNFVAFDASFTGGARVAAVDVNRDGQTDLVVGAGPLGTPQIKAFDAVSLAELDNFFAFGSTFQGGVFVA